MDEFPSHGTIFTYDDRILKNIELFLDETKKEVIILSPWVNPTGHMRDKIKVMRDKGAEFILLTREPKPTREDYAHKQAIKWFQSIGVEVFYDNRLHGKMMLFDRELIMVMSANLVLSSMTNNHEVAMASDNLGVVEEAIDYLQYLENVLGHPIISRFAHLFPKRSVRSVMKPLTRWFKKFIKEKEEEEEEEEPKTCPLCKNPLVIRKGSYYGSFWGCSSYPKCDYTKNIEDKRRWKNKK